MVLSAAPAPTSELNELVGQTIDGKYRVDELLGEGGMGAVFAATHLAIGKRVALKFLRRDAVRAADAVARFQREATAAAAVESEHIVQVFDSGRTEDGLPFLVMELLRGEDLRARLRREGRLAAPTAAAIAGQVCLALRRAHAAGIVHRDLKPDNVFLQEQDGGGQLVKLVDFGISKVVRGLATEPTLTRHGVVLGTAHYMAPEQAQADPLVDGRADLFSLGAILFETLAGRPPWMAPAYEAILVKICTEDAPDVRRFAPSVSADMAAVVARALARQRDRRYSSARELYDALRGCYPESLAALADNSGELDRAAVEHALTVASDAPPPLDDGAIRASRASTRPSGTPASGSVTDRDAVGPADAPERRPGRDGGESGLGSLAFAGLAGVLITVALIAVLAQPGTDERRAPADARGVTEREAETASTPGGEPEATSSAPEASTTAPSPSVPASASARVGAPSASTTAAPTARPSATDRGTGQAPASTAAPSGVVVDLELVTEP